MSWKHVLKGGALGLAAYAVCNRFYGEKAARVKEVPEVVVITDVGKDIDDTVSLLFMCALMKKKKLMVRGVVCTGGSSEKRAAVARKLLDNMLPGNNVAVVEGFPTKLNGDQFPNHEVLTHDLPSYSKDPRNDRTFADVLSACTSPTIVCLGPLTDLASYLKDAFEPANKIKAVLVQGQSEGTEPDPASYNLRCDIMAARIVFGKCVQNNIKLVLLGKHAAYQAPLHLQHIEEIDSAGTGLNPWTLKELVSITLTEFVRDDSEEASTTLKAAYKIDRESLVQDSPSTPVLVARILSTFPHLTVPYDPLCCMALGHIYPSLAPYAACLPFESTTPPILCIGNTPSSPPINADRALTLLIDTCKIAVDTNIKYTP
eukprot:TRINITY_DN11981_c0_g1_i1.p1 TRINITY_DN11981_c0_g1~~TRINITY_DN11981_c0_g1_i1.p1  ORF type:complete len:373 (+),score=75.00 TRINITY_DN11981_c0_g1_i1:38-1156(+)